MYTVSSDALENKQTLVAFIIQGQEWMAWENRWVAPGKSWVCIVHSSLTWLLIHVNLVYVMGHEEAWDKMRNCGPRQDSSRNLVPGQRVCGSYWRLMPVCFSEHRAEGWSREPETRTPGQETASRSNMVSCGLNQLNSWFFPESGLLIWEQ